MFFHQQFRAGSMIGETFARFDNGDTGDLTDEAASDGHLAIVVTSLPIDSFEERLQLTFVTAHDSNISRRTIGRRF